MISLNLPDSISYVDSSHQTWQSVAVVVIDVLVVDVVIALHHHAAVVIVGQ